ncbi:hypothetical protein [Nocardia sp. NPDC004604]|uniref:hypothetical protein n=1 Tax=Nocardia sp. NPDC004604 TaxID=3157013 RepID=UPI0033A1CAD8
MTETAQFNGKGSVEMTVTFTRSLPPIGSGISTPADAMPGNAATAPAATNEANTARIMLRRMIFLLSDLPGEIAPQSR